MAVVVAARCAYIHAIGHMHISMPWHMFAQTQAAIVEGCLRRRGASLQVQATTAVAAAVAVCWHRMAMPMAPVKLSKQWSVEGGAMGGKPVGLDTKDDDTASGAVSFVKLEKYAEWMLKATLGTAAKGALRKSTLFSFLGKRLEETIANPDSRLSLIHI